MRNSWLATVLGLGLLATGCGAAAGARASAPAADGVRTLIAALGQDNPAAGYALLSSQTRKQISFAEFSIRWKQTSAERTQHAKSLTDSIRIDATAGERAAVRLSNGRVAYLVRTGTTWSLETPLVATAVAIKPRDAVQLFARAIAEREPCVLPRPRVLGEEGGKFRRLRRVVEVLDRRRAAQEDQPFRGWVP